MSLYRYTAAEKAEAVALANQTSVRHASDRLGIYWRNIYRWLGSPAFADAPRDGRRGRTTPVRPLEDRFWEKVDKSGDCWLWTGARDQHGYGSLSVAHEGRERRRSVPVKASRVSWQIHNGPIPAGMWVLHRCDNPPCVRPDHLFLGTQLDNMRDASAKGRLNVPRPRRCPRCEVPVHRKGGESA
jgi:hypothetical protein